MNNFLPKWHRELDIFHKIKPLIIIDGNILDIFEYPVEGDLRGSILRLPQYLHYYLKKCGYDIIAFYDNMQGFHNRNESACIDKFAGICGAKTQNNAIVVDFKGKSGASVPVRQALTQNEIPTAIVMDFASRYIVSPDNIDQAEVDSFTNLMITAMDSSEVCTAEKGFVKNILILLVNKLNDIPAWLYLNNPNVKSITIGTPSKDERENFVKGENFEVFFDNDIYTKDIGFYRDKNDELIKIQEKFIALTEGFSFTELNSLRILCQNEKFRISNMCGVIDLYKYGIRDNPWNASGLIEKLKSTEADFEKRVKGQKTAIVKSLDIVKRAVTGMSGIQHSSYGKPKGVLFFAGPTGTGKTETAKTLAEKIFGDENCCIRFDMSEYSQSHSDQKLLGAPPGYVGYDAGGQLTNAVKANPFSILLFDEIEKAHPLIFDKFLQILEDGRMTDGQGNTVYFSETIIIFTSNLGIYTKDQHGQRQENVSQEMNYTEIQSKVKSAIEDYFKLELGRPEILNRIGENIVVFDFIRPEAAKLILDSQINKIISVLASEKNINISLSGDSRETLLKSALMNLHNGGRGIGNIVESQFVNPLSRYMFDNYMIKDLGLIIESVNIDEDPISITCNLADIRDTARVTVPAALAG